MRCSVRCCPVCLVGCHCWSYLTVSGLPDPSYAAWSGAYQQRGAAPRPLLQKSWQQSSPCVEAAPEREVHPMCVSEPAPTVGEGKSPLLCLADAACRGASSCRQSGQAG